MKIALLLLAAAICPASDWPCAGGGRQKHDTNLTRENIAKLQLVLKLKLTSTPLFPPVILGRVVTAKGIQDLVFAAAKNDVWAVDPDLGRILWQRHVDDPITGPLMIGESIEPTQPDDDDDSDDVNIALRPIYLSKLRAISPRSGADVSVSGKVNCTQPAEDSTVNDITFRLKNNKGKGELSAFDSSNVRIFSAQIPNPITDYGPAIANGHICFGDTKGYLYCFGFPADL